jgi:hypothetical protein
MTDQSKPRTKRRRSLYRTVLSLGVAALVAAWLPFLVLYTAAPTQRAVAVTSVAGKQRTVIVTSASGTRSTVLASAAPNVQPTLVSTHSS